MKKVNWWIVGIVAVLVAVFLFGGGMTLAPGASAGVWGNRGYGMMGGYGGHMGWGFSPFGWFGMGFGMLFMWLIPVGVIAIIVYGVVGLTRNAGNPPPAAPLTPCSNCGKGIQADWRNCPYCGASLK